MFNAAGGIHPGQLKCRTPVVMKPHERVVTAGVARFSGSWDDAKAM
jgi:hypothetical protein